MRSPPAKTGTPIITFFDSESKTVNKLSSKEEKNLRSELNEFAAQLEKLFKERGYWNEEKTLMPNLKEHQGELEQILKASGFKQVIYCLTIRNKLQHPDPNDPAHVSNPSQFATDANKLVGLLQDTLGGKVDVFNWGRVPRFWKAWPTTGAHFIWDRVVRFWKAWPKTGAQVLAVIVAVVHFIYYVREPEQELLNTLHGSLYAAGISCFLSIFLLFQFSRDCNAFYGIKNSLVYWLYVAQDDWHFFYKVASLFFGLVVLVNATTSDFWSRLADSFFVTTMICFVYIFVVDPFVIMRNDANLE